MEGTYEVLLADKPVGKVQVIRDGLYCRFFCRCKLTGDVVCKLYVRTEEGKESLGVLVPMGDGFGLETKLPAKRLGRGRIEFLVVPNRVVVAGRFVPISPEEPFSYIERLKSAYLARQNGHVGVVIQEKAGT